MAGQAVVGIASRWLRPALPSTHAKEMNMIRWQNSRISISRDIARPAPRVWTLLTDTRHWPRWGPSVTAVECHDQPIRAGSTGRIRLPVGLWLPFVITDLEPLRCWNWRVGGITATGHSLCTLAADHCRLSFDMPWWAPWYLPVCWYALRRIEELAETGSA
jgi:uncharacterized protein YndB with AHSA1/START domain